LKPNEAGNGGATNNMSDLTGGGDGSTLQSNDSANGNNIKNNYQQRTNNFSQNNRAAPRGVVNCKLCDVACTGRDAYAAHLRGSKHLKTLKLHQKLGKPIPADLLLPNNQPGTAAPTSEAAAASNNGNQMMGGGHPVSISAPQVNYIAGVSIAKSSANETTTPTPLMQNQPTPLFDLKPQAPGAILQLMTTQIKLTASQIKQQQDASQEDNDDDDYNCEPVGKEYIETRVNGKIVSFYCKLCDCQFNDPNAKEMHTKGKRHRLSYKVSSPQIPRIFLFHNLHHTNRSGLFLTYFSAFLSFHLCTRGKF
jgi:hypothetical protein